METGVFTIFYSERDGYKAGPNEQLECPIELSELIFRLTVENVQIWPDWKTCDNICDFFDNLWEKRILCEWSTAKNIAAARFSYMGYSYWISMSQMFFEYAKRKNIVNVPNEFRRRTVSGYFLKD